ncbi:P-type conjugative transfer protein TrbG [Chlorobium sp. N1]|uniref:P-type conjugative transfer protein TrbG n=1 Tax=Chlorobium sp. N1 TaxID=2491138 RepID=UPI00103D125D|nr:P-type conjugative transfer protein TrbG [Chlorobium sp. N1]TCD46900.1 P-type conjugative transfer protein TrbG [Chlorobium sp. N1]
MNKRTTAIVSLLVATGLSGSEVHATPWKVIDNANRSAQINPDAHGYMNAIMQYDYEPGQLYQVYGAPLRITDIQFEPGEYLTSEPVGGDAIRWILARTKSKINGIDQEHIYVKPTRPGLKTTLSINTNLRTYHIELTSYEQTYMPAVSWNYEQYNMQQIRQETESSIEPKVNLSALSFQYRIKVQKGGKPSWMPVKVFDDGQKTFIQFPQAMLSHESPALFVLGRSGDIQLVNFRQKDDYYIVDRLFDRAELRAGEKGRNIIRITKSR